VDIHMWLFFLNILNRNTLRPQVLMSPCLAEGLAKGGYDKARIKQYWFEQARFPARRWEELQLKGMESIYGNVAANKLPAMYGESNDPERLLPIVQRPEDFMITVSGDPDRDNAFICGQNGFIGYPVSKKIQLPAKWAELRNRPI